MAAKKAAKGVAESGSVPAVALTAVAAPSVLGAVEFLVVAAASVLWAAEFYFYLRVFFHTS